MNRAPKMAETENWITQMTGKNEFVSFGMIVSANSSCDRKNLHPLSFRYQ